MSFLKELAFFKVSKSENSDYSNDNLSNSNTIVCRQIKFNFGLWVLMLLINQA